jgi:hypothetical protein
MAADRRPKQIRYLFCIPLGSSAGKSTAEESYEEQQKPDNLFALGTLL